MGTNITQPQPGVDSALFLNVFQTPGRSNHVAVNTALNGSLFICLLKVYLFMYWLVTIRFTTLFLWSEKGEIRLFVREESLWVEQFLCNVMFIVLHHLFLRNNWLHVVCSSAGFCMFVLSLVKKHYRLQFYMVCIGQVTPSSTCLPLLLLSSSSSSSSPDSVLPTFCFVSKAVVDKVSVLVIQWLAIIKFITVMVFLW